MADQYTLELDTKLAEIAATTNYGSGTTVEMGRTAAKAGYDVHFLFRRDLSGLGEGKEAGSDVVSAYLKLYVELVSGNPESSTFPLYRCLRNTVEGEATWTIYSTGNNWGTAGGLGSGTDFDSGDSASFTGPSGTGWLSIDITDWIKDILDNHSGDANGIIHSPEVNSRYFRIRTKEYAGTDYDPYIEVEWAAAGEHYRDVAGSLTPTGALKVKVPKAFVGTLSFQGSVVKARNIQVSAAFDDGDIWDPSGYGALGDLANVGHYAGVPYSSWFRFAGVPLGASLLEGVFIKLKAAVSASNTVCRLRIYGEAADDPSYPTSYADYWARTRTQAYVNWEPDAWTSGEWYGLDVDIKAIVNELMARPGWVAGNAMQFFIQDNGSDTSAVRYWSTWNSAPANAPVLRIIYGLGWISLAGTLASAGALAMVLTAKKAVGGALGSTGAVAKAVEWSRTLVGVLAPSGTVTSATTWARSLAGTLAMAGGLVRLVSHSFAGVVTSAGALIVGVGKSVGGVLTFAGSVLRKVSTFPTGILAPAGYLAPKLLTEVAYKSLVGVLTSSGALVRKISKRRFVGRITSIVGTLGTAATWSRTLSGTLSSSGAVVAKGGVVLGGTLTSAGGLVVQVGKMLSGTLTSSGILSTIVTRYRSLAGTMASAGSLTAVKFVGTYYRTFTGIITPSGTLVRKTLIGLTGTLSSNGVVTTVATWARSLAGAMSSAGALTKRFIKGLLWGSLAPTGALAVTAETVKALSGVLTSAGALATTLYKFITPVSIGGTLTPTGALISVRVTLQSIAGTLTSAGAVATQFVTGKAIGGTLAMAGSLVSVASKILGGVLAPVGVLRRMTTVSLAGVLGFAGRVYLGVAGRGRLLPGRASARSVTRPGASAETTTMPPGVAEGDTVPGASAEEIQE